MASRAHDSNGEILRRLARLEFLAALAFIAGPNKDTISEETRHVINEFLNEFARRAGTSGIRDFQRLVQHLAPLTDAARFERLGQLRELREELGRLQTDLRKSQEGIRESEAGHREFQSWVREKVDDFAGDFVEVIGSIDLLQHGQTTLSANTHEWLAVQSLGIDSSKARLSRFLPLRAYLSEVHGDTVEDISQAIGSVLEAFGFEIADEFPAEHGSWYKKWFAKTTEVMTQPEVAERLAKLERALELKGLGRPQAEIDEKQAAAVSHLITAVKDTPNAAIQVGSILLIKLSGPNGAAIKVRTLTQMELIHLENNQSLLDSPSDLLERLSDVCRSGAQGGTAQLTFEETEKEPDDEDVPARYPEGVKRSLRL